MIVRTKQRRKMARRQRAMATDLAVRPNQRWSMDFVSDKLAEMGIHSAFSRAVDQFTCECVGLEADRSMMGKKVADVLECARQERGRLRKRVSQLKSLIEKRNNIVGTAQALLLKTDINAEDRRAFDRMMGWRTTS